MKTLRYIKTSGDLVCQIQYDKPTFLQDIGDYQYGLSKINNPRCHALTLNVYNYSGISVSFGEIINDDSALYEMEDGEIFDGLPDDTFYQEDYGVEFNHLIVSPHYVGFVGYTIKREEEFYADILVKDLESLIG